MTARIRLARALARLGHTVMVICNCPREHNFDGVRYLPLSAVRRIDTEVLILHTTGGGVNLRPILDVDVHCRLRVVWLGGVLRPHGLSEVSPDFLVAPSNFVRGVALGEWGMPPDRIFVVHNGIEREFFSHVDLRQWRDYFRLIYVGHPEKGLEAAIAVLDLLRAHDARFELYVYGGYELWGEEEQTVPRKPGLVYRGLVDQRRLARELRVSSFSVSLQAIPEAFGIGVAEAMAAGCIVLASNVGALAEVIRHGYNGVLVPGDHKAADVQHRAARWIISFTERPNFADYIRRNAITAPLDWEAVARTWEGFCVMALADAEDRVGLQGEEEWGACPECGGTRVPLADGYHCTRCGRHERGF